MLGAVPLLATTPIFDTLGEPCAFFLLAFLRLLMCGLPVGFLRWDDSLRECSRSLSLSL